MSEPTQHPPKWRIAWQQESERVPGHKPTITRHVSVIEAATLQLALDAWSRQCYINARVLAVWNDSECECVRKGSADVKIVAATLGIALEPPRNSMKLKSAALMVELCEALASGEALPRVAVRSPDGLTTEMRAHEYRFRHVARCAAEAESLRANLDMATCAGLQRRHGAWRAEV